MTERVRTLTVIEHYEPDEERQLAAILMVLSRAARRRDGEMRRSQLEAGSDAGNPRCLSNACKIENHEDDNPRD
jgi:hypothetical protein